MIQNPQLSKYRGLIPIEPLAGYFAGPKLNDTRQRELNLSTRGW